MKRNALFFVGMMGMLLVGFAACSLNPQPLPPDNPDGAGIGLDATGNVPDAFVGDGSFFTDSEPPGADAEAGYDAGAGVDAAEDAPADAPADAPIDVGDDGPRDATDS